MSQPQGKRLRETPLQQCHELLGAKLGEFAGWRLPMSYGRVSDEVKAVRQEMGVFDVSHLALIRVTGCDATAFLDRLLTNHAAPVKRGHALYSLLCNDQGGVIDDLLAYRLGETDWLCVMNASRAEVDYGWMRSHLQGKVTLTLEWQVIIAVQGPLARTLVSGLLVEEAALLRRNSFLVTTTDEGEMTIACTGYTGEDGFELGVPPAAGPLLWDRIIDAGAIPCGLAARDVLRLEAGLPLYGHEWTETRSPFECGYGWAVKLTKSEFVGKAALEQIARRGGAGKLIGLVMSDRAVPRAEYEVLFDGAVIGQVTSGTFSPTLSKSIAMAFVRQPAPAVGELVSVRVRQQLHEAKVVQLPFYRSEGA